MTPRLALQCSLPVAVLACTSLAGLDRLSFEAGMAAAGGGALQGGASASGGAGGGAAGGGGPVPCTPGEAVVCYDGPAETANQGTCTNGIGTCNASGDGWLGCAGQIVPQPDACDTPLDEDCSGTVNDHCATFGVMLSVSGTETPHDVAIGADGAIAVVGTVRGDVTVGSAVVDCQDVSPALQAALILLEADGTPRWGHCWGAQGTEESLLGVALDSSGEVFATGFYEGTLNIDGTDHPLVGLRDMFIARVGPTGSIGGTFFSGAAGEAQQGEGIAVDSEDNFIVVGTFGGMLSGLTAQDDDVFVLKFDQSGTLLWELRLGDAGNEFGARVAVTANDDLIVAGRFNNDVFLGGASLSDASSGGTFVTRLSGASGSLIWATVIGGEGSQVPEAVAFEGSRVAVAGRVKTEIDFGAGPQPVVGIEDAWLATLDAATGQVIWGDAWGAAGRAIQGTDVTFGPAGAVTITGEFEGSIDFGGGAIVNTDDTTSASDGFLVTLAADGSHLWSRSFGGAADDDGLALDIDSAGRLVLVGETDSTFDFGSISLAGDGIFVVRVDL